MLFEVDAKQITDLDSRGLVELFRRLALAECSATGVPLRGAQVPLQLTVPDEGEDARVSWEGAVEATDYFPARYNAFQMKARKLSDAILKNELHRPATEGPSLNSAISDVLRNAGAYIIVCSHPYGPQRISKFRRVIRQLIELAGENAEQAGCIDVYDANRLRDWTNQHPTVALWLNSIQGRPAGSGLLTYERWASADAISQVPWADDGQPRYQLSRKREAGGADQEPSGNGAEIATFAEARAAVLQRVSHAKNEVRIFGPSGFGKTRFAFEVFSGGTTISAQADRVGIIFADYTVTGDELLQIALQLAESSSAVVLVVDECPDAIHFKLTELSRRSGSQLRLVTLDVESAVTHSDQTLTVQLHQASDRLIASIAVGIAPDLSESTSSLVQVLARGFPRMAVLAAQNKGDGRATLQSIGQLVDRIIWGRATPDRQALQCLEALSLFEWVGLVEDAQHQGEFVATKVARVAFADFFRHLMEFKKRGILVQRGRFVRLEPIPLAIHLASGFLSKSRPQTMLTTFEEAEVALQDSMLRRVRWLDQSPEVIAFAEQFLARDRLGNVDALKTKRGCEILSRLVHVSPNLVMATLDRVLGSLSVEDLDRVVEVRRDIVWCLARLVFRRPTFLSAATLLRRLGSSNLDDPFEKEAREVFTGLFQLYLSGTEADPVIRQSVLEAGLTSTDDGEKRLCIEALGKMLETNHFSRSGGDEVIGTGAPTKDWQPTSWDQVREYHRYGMAKLACIVVSEGVHSDFARNVLGNRIRGLLSTLPFEDVKGVIETVRAKKGIWPEAVQEINEWLYFDRRDAEADHAAQVRAYFDELMPTDPIELVALYTKGWQGDFHDPNETYDPKASHLDHNYPSRKAAELAKEIVANPDLVAKAFQRFVQGEEKTISTFAQHLALSSSDPVDLFAKAVAALPADCQPNRSFFAGLVFGTDQRSPDAARACVRLALRHPELARDPVGLIGSGKLQPADLALVVSLLGDGVIEPSRCVPLSYGRGLDHLEPKDFLPLLLALVEHGAEGQFAALEMTGMYLHDSRQPAKELVRLVQRILTKPGLLTADRARTMDKHYLETSVDMLDRCGALTPQYGRTLARAFLRVCTRRSSPTHLQFGGTIRSVLRRLISRHPEMAWDEVAPLLLETAWKVKHRVDQLMKPEPDDHFGAGLLFALPESIYLEWVAQDPAVRAKLVMAWLPIVQDANGDQLAWHSTLQSFAEAHANEPDVLAVLGLRLRTGSGWGSHANKLQAAVDLIQRWESHPNERLRRWSVDMAAAIMEWMRQLRRRDEEDGTRFS